MSEIRTNEIIPHFDYQKIDTEYDIFCLETSRKYISTGAGIIDAPLMNKNVRAVLFETGRRFYVLLNHSEDNFGNMKKILSDAEYGSSMSLMQKKSSDLEKYQLLQLLINGLTAKKHPLLRFNNLTGHLYVFRPEWTHKSKENVIWSIPTIEVRVMEDCLIKLNVRTFTSTRLRSKITFTKKKFEEYPKYVLSTDNSMRRKTADDDAKTPDFILRQIDGRKSGVKFLNISSETDFEATKIGVLNEVAENFNERYSGMAAIEFKTIAENFKKKAGVNYAASRGEYLNSNIMADYLGFPFIDAAEVIRFDENGDFDSETTYDILKERLKDVDNAVIPGFYEAYADGSVKTFSRVGSDISGSIVARAVKADVYENWTDVSGFLIADPRIIENPERIDTITYRELRELSYMGASVLHEDAIFPVRREGIPINIRNTNRPQDEGTWIVESTCQKCKYVVTGIAGKKGFCAVNIDKAMMNSEIGFGRKVLQAFEDYGISFEHVPSGIDTMTVFVHQDEFMDKEQKVVSAIHRLADPDSIDIEADLALIAVVGRGMKSTRGTAGRIFSALAHANVNVKMIDQGSSELNIIIGVANEDFETAIKAIYDIFVLARL